ncbi:nucleoid-associated protein YgaU [Nocardioides thalensis]|uniref:Nucleoid-associated protein YgaU n=1 Tax=Nocardioides thalensis TaxID=1914755 RepID=A0A853BZA3_9ACTN|nr:hypothetical protein [Nocardioides thalensis]NYJ00565.1 nucleoid-associated protein YgaU [Nocardioides thalensis]
MPRVYVPATLATLGEYVAAGRVPAATERVVAPADDEETEYAALMTAADLSAEAVSGDGRRVVITVETAGDGGGDLAWADVVAVHADTEPFTDPDDDLAWFATQEVGDLLAGAG